MPKDTPQQKAWKFDPQEAVALMFSDCEREMFMFDRQIQFYLLYLWALWPTTDHLAGEGATPNVTGNSNARRLKDAARCMGALIAFSKIEEDRAGEHSVSGEAINEIRELIEQVSTDWYKPFDEMFLRPLGGLATQILEGENGKSHAKLISESWDHSLISRDIIRYLSCVVTSYPGYQSVKTLSACLQGNIFGSGDYRRRKRKGENVSESTIQDAWQKGLPTAVLLYALERAFPKILGIDMGKAHFPIALGLRLSRENCRRALLYYKQLMIRLSPIISIHSSSRRWQVLHISAPVPTKLIAKIERQEQFTDDERAKFEAIHPGAKRVNLI